MEKEPKTELLEWNPASKEALDQAIRLSVEEAVTKELKHRKKRFVRRLVLTGAAVAAGVYLYRHSDQVKAFLTEKRKQIPDISSFLKK